MQRKILRTTTTIIAFALINSACSKATPQSPELSNSPNSLAVGPQVEAKEVKVELRDAEDFNYKKRADILGLRQKYVELSPQLVPAPYHPYEPIFRAVEDDKPWWGLKGRSIYGAGPKSIDGKAEESRFVSNPLLLVGGDSATANIFKQELVTSEDLNDPEFPYAWKPLSLTFWPKQSLAQVVYDVTKFNDTLYRFREKMTKPVIFPAFSLVAYNARDFGYNYIWLSQENSINIENLAKPEAEPVLIRQMIHCGGTCGVPGGCNNMSPQTIQIDRIKYTKLPARAYIKLWKNKPEKVSDEADMTYMIDLH